MILYQIFVVFAFFRACSGNNPWVNALEPLAEYYVSPNPLPGANGTSTSPFGLEDASRIGGPGDLFWLYGGNYASANFSFSISCRGDANDPCVFRCVAGDRCIFGGVVQIKTSYTWLWGMEIRLLGNPPFNSSACMLSVASGTNTTVTGVHLINNIIHRNSKPYQGICSTNDTGTIIYGNIASGYISNLRISNDFLNSASSYKYVVANIFVDSFNSSSNNVDARGFDTATTGLYFSKNLIVNGTFILGSNSTPDFENYLIRNLYHNATAKIGTGQPLQVEIISNLFSFSTLEVLSLWGQLDNVNTLPPSVTVVKGNTFVRPLGQLIKFGTRSTQKDSRDVIRILPSDIQPTDFWDNNIFENRAFSVHYDASYILEQVSLPAEWNVLTRNGGNRFDLNSEFDYIAPQRDWKVVRNEYDPTRLNLVFTDTLRTGSAVYDLCCFLAPQPTWSIYAYDNLYGGPLATAGNCSQVEIVFAVDGVRVAVAITGNPVTRPQLESCGTHWAQDVEPARLARVIEEKEFLNTEIITAAVAGLVILLVLISGSFLWWTVRNRHLRLENPKMDGYGDQIQDIDLTNEILAHIDTSQSKGENTTDSLSAGPTNDPPAVKLEDHQDLDDSSSSNH